MWVWGRADPRYRSSSFFLLPSPSFGTGQLQGPHRHAVWPTPQLCSTFQLPLGVAHTQPTLSCLHVSKPSENALGQVNGAQGIFPASPRV